MRAACGSLEADSLKGLRATAIKVPDDAIQRQACSEEEGGRAAFQREAFGRCARAGRFERKGPTGLGGFTPGGDRQTFADQRSRKDRRRMAAADGAQAIEAAIMGAGRLRVADRNRRAVVMAEDERPVRPGRIHLRAGKCRRDRLHDKQLRGDDDHREGGGTIRKEAPERNHGHADSILQTP